MDLRPQAPEIPSAADEVPIDDLLAGVRTTAELNELIREGLAAARRGGQDFPGVHPWQVELHPITEKEAKALVDGTRIADPGHRPALGRCR
jgi:hypothetical protein